MDCKARLNDSGLLFQYQVYEGLHCFRKTRKLLQVLEELKNPQA